MFNELYFNVVKLFKQENIVVMYIYIYIYIASTIGEEKNLLRYKISLHASTNIIFRGTFP